MRHILVSMPDDFDREAHIVLAPSLTRGRWVVGVAPAISPATSVGDAFEVQLGADSIVNLPAGASTTIRIAEEVGEE